MAGFTSDSGSEYDLDLTTSDEELLWAIVDRLSAGSALPPAIPATPATPARRPIASTPFSPDLDPDATLAVEEAIAAIADDDLSFDISELHDDDDDGDDDGDDDDDDFSDDDFDDDDFNHGQTAARRHDDASRNSTPERQNRRLAPSVSGDDDHLASFVSKTNPRSMPRLLPGPDVHYPDCKLSPTSYSLQVV